LAANRTCDTTRSLIEERVLFHNGNNKKNKKNKIKINNNNKTPEKSWLSLAMTGTAPFSSSASQF